MHQKKQLAIYLGNLLAMSEWKLHVYVMFLSSGSFKMIIWVAEVQLKRVLAGWLSPGSFISQFITF